MIQCFVKRDYMSSFSKGTTPRLLSASDIHMDYSQHKRAMHNHNDRCELLFVRDGSANYVISGQTYPLTKGDMVITNCGALHDEVYGKDNHVSYYSLAIDHLNIPGLPENHLIDDSFKPVIPTGSLYSTFNGLFRSIYELLVSNDVGVEESCHYLMMSVLSLLLSLIRSSNTRIVTEDSSDMIQQIRSYLDQNYMTDLTLHSISSQFHISTYYLSHIFKDETGYSPMNYVIRRRIGEAQSLLISTKMSITDISMRVGFSNPNNFNIQFQKQVGLSPRSYRKTYTIE